jgi:uncharacterized protein with FMN-binding domain
MRRALPAFFATVGALALLSTFHTNTGTTVQTAASSTRSAADASTTTVTQPAPTAPPPGPDQQLQGGDEGDDFGPPSTAATTSAPATTAGTVKSGRRTIDGPVVTNRFGDVQVRVVVEGKKLVDVQALTLHSDRARSAYISQQAGPMLRTEALQAGNANINLIGGATYTSDSYAQSLQAALNQAGIK